MSAHDHEPGLEAGRTRRRFLRDAAVAGGALVGGSTLLEACGSETSKTVAALGKPKMGGVLRIGLSGGGGTDNLDPQKASTNPDLARARNLFDLLADRDHQFRIVPALGTEFIPNAKGNEMIVKLRPGVTWHDGKPFTSADVVFSYRRMLNPKVGAAQLALLGPIVDSVDAIDPLSVRFRFKLPFYDFEDFASNLETAIVPVDFDPMHPIGTGPFKYQSFTPGQQSVFTRNDHYWGADIGFLGSNGPYVDSLVITDISDDATRVDALVSGAVDGVDSIPYSDVSTVQSNSSLAVLDSKSGNWNPITMRVDRPPFNDARVRQAFRLMANRPQIVSDAADGRATLGNDLYGIQDPLYANDIPQRKQDIEQAKFLLKQAGQEGLTANLVVAPIVNGVVQQCVVFAEQTKAAGVNVQLTKLDNTTFFNSEYLQRTFSIDFWSTLSFIYYTANVTVTGGTFNETHYANPQMDKWYYEIVGTPDQALRKEIAHSMQEVLWNEGGLIIPDFPDVVDGYSKKVSGFVPDKDGYNLSSWEFKNAWFV